MKAEALKLDPEDGGPLHVRVEALLRRMAGRREYVGGQVLPGEVALARELGVSRSTVRQAMGRLTAEGLLERRRNAGTRVAARPVVTRLADWGSFTAEMGRQGVRLVTREIAFEVAGVPGEVAKFFGVATGRRCLHVTRVRGDEEGAMVEFRSWFHPRLGLSEGDDFSVPLYELIERKAGVVVARSSERIGAVVADEALAGRLGCEVGAAVLSRQRRVSDAAGGAVEWCECRYRADRFTYELDLRREAV